MTTTIQTVASVTRVLPRGANPKPKLRMFTGLMGRAEPVAALEPVTVAEPVIDAAMVQTVKQVLTAEESERFLAGAPPTLAPKVALSGAARAKKYRDKQGAAGREKERLRKEAERLDQKVEETMALPEFNVNRGMSMTDAPSGKGKLVTGGYSSAKVDSVLGAVDGADAVLGAVDPDAPNGGEDSGEPIGGRRKVVPEGTSPDTDDKASTRRRFKVGGLTAPEETAKGKKMRKLGKEILSVEDARLALEKRRQARKEGLCKPVGAKS